MNKKYFFSATWVALPFVWISCSPKIIAQTNREVKDSVIVREVLREVRVTTPADSVTVIKFILCDSLRKTIVLKAKSKQASVRLSISQDVITATANCDTLVHQLQVKVKEIERFRSTSQNSQKEIAVYKTRTIDTICRWVAALAILYLVFMSRRLFNG